MSNEAASCSLFFPSLAVPLLTSLPISPEIPTGVSGVILHDWLMLRLLSAWAATTHNNDYIRMEGLKRLIDGSKHRKEIVAGGLPAYLTAGASSPLLQGKVNTDRFVEYRNLVDRLGSRASAFDSAYEDADNDRGFRLVRFFILPLSEFLQVCPQQPIFSFV